MTDAAGRFHGEPTVLVTERSITAFTGTDDIGEHEKNDAAKHGQSEPRAW
ncbi:MAG: hypothetical protein ACQEQY_06575 [Halobacteriota archaeon]